ncbi:MULTISPECIES: hypothetical protein [unclassified Bartonella]|uniref:hypothetical protein n=1 Tax=unclassified Bartonella TaxID=2645622 RepID=UPI0035D07287
MAIVRGKVYGNAHVFGNASVDIYAEVYGNARVFGNASVHNDVSDNVVITGREKTLEKVA